MGFPPRLIRFGALGALVSALLVGGPVVASSATAAPAPVAHAVTAPAPAADFGDIGYSGLPPEAHGTLDLIEDGGPYPYPQDGTVFQNRHLLGPEGTELVCPVAFKPGCAPGYPLREDGYGSHLPVQGVVRSLVVRVR